MSTPPDTTTPQPTPARVPTEELAVFAVALSKDAPNRNSIFLHKSIVKNLNMTATRLRELECALRITSNNAATAVEQATRELREELTTANGNFRAMLGVEQRLRAELAALRADKERRMEREELFIRELTMQKNQNKMGFCFIATKAAIDAARNGKERAP